MLAEYLLRLGHKKVAFLSTSLLQKDNLPEEPELKGFVRLLKKPDMETAFM